MTSTPADIRPGAQRGQVALTQFLNERHQRWRADGQRLESRIHTMELALRTQTILNQTGFDHKQLIYRYSGRDYRLTGVRGKVFSGVIAWRS